MSNKYLVNIGIMGMSSDTAKEYVESIKQNLSQNLFEKDDRVAYVPIFEYSGLVVEKIN